MRRFCDTQKAGEENGLTDIPRIIEENFDAFATLRHLSPPDMQEPLSSGYSGDVV